MTSSSVVFPAPDAPINACTLPCSNDAVTFDNRASGSDDAFAFVTVYETSSTTTSPLAIGARETAREKVRETSPDDMSASVNEEVRRAPRCASARADAVRAQVFDPNAQALSAQLNYTFKCKITEGKGIDLKDAVIYIDVKGLAICDPRPTVRSSGPRCVGGAA